MRRATLRWAALALAGVLVAAVAAYAASRLATQPIGLSSEPIDAGQSLAPRATPEPRRIATPRPTPSPTRVATPAATAPPVSTPAPATATARPGGSGDDSGGDDRGGGDD